MAVQPRRIRGAVLLGLCLCSIWTFSAQQAFTKTEVIEETDVSTGVKLVAEHPLLFSFLSMALCGALCCTENSATPRQGNAEDRADYNSFLMIQNILCFASGIVNALTIIDMGMTVSHQSGNTSHTGRLIMNGGAKFGHLLASFCFGSFFAGFSKSDCEAIYSGRYSPNLLAATIAVVLGCTVHYCKEHGGAGNDNTSGEENDGNKRGDDAIETFAFVEFQADKRIMGRSSFIKLKPQRMLAALRLLSGYPERHHPPLLVAAHLHHSLHWLPHRRGHRLRRLGPCHHERREASYPPQGLALLRGHPLLLAGWRSGQGASRALQHAGCFGGCRPHGRDLRWAGPRGEGEEDLPVRTFGAAIGRFFPRFKSFTTHCGCEPFARVWRRSPILRSQCGGTIWVFLACRWI
ncbi:unnamed protein product [Durusdinium trenchii]|uniref:Uncharacterized protein n=1 Tax=Durusdinium trenchii TaxID=1381693 RepID=A0ABP0NE33_9DINO